MHCSERVGCSTFPILGIDTDNGSEFINEELLAYCASEQLTFTRGRVGNKNDACFIEQKNGSVVRQLVGYDRFEGERAYRQLAELYRAARLYVNFFQPSMKLRTKTRTGSRVRRTYGPAQTPFQRVLASGVLDAAGQRRLNTVYRALDPVRLLHQLETLQEALWRHALFRTRGSSPTSDLLKSWGEPGNAQELRNTKNKPGYFHTPHGIGVHGDKVFVCDRENNRIQVDTTDGEFVEIWTMMERPTDMYISPEGVVYISELEDHVSIRELQGNEIGRFGSERSH
jgi:hypothetical protein